jgi:hypothetical protein
MNKIKIFFVTLGLLCCGTASAEWTWSGGNDQFNHYVDRATIRRSGNFVKMWDLFDYKTVQKAAGGESYLSGKTQWEFDCKEEKSRMLAFTWFDEKMGSGKVVYSDNDTGKWAPIQPESIGEALWKIACGKK